MADSSQLEPTSRRTRATGLIALALAAAAMLALSLFLASRSARPTVLWLELRTVPGDQLISSGTTLLPSPPGAEAQAVPRSVAEQVAAEQEPGVAIEEVVLARLLDGSMASGRLTWVVSLDPATAHGPASHGPGPTGPVSVPRPAERWMNDFALVFVDALTGEFMHGTVVSHVVVPQPGS